MSAPNLPRAAVAALLVASPLADARAEPPATGATERGVVRVAAPAAVKASPALDYALGRYARRIAVTIGVNAYAGDPWPRLGAAVEDARRIGSLLKDMGFDDVETVDERAATKSGLLDLLERRLPVKTGPLDLVVIYFAGHGATAGDQGYIIPLDGGEDLPKTAISVRQLKESALRMASKHVVFLVDACFSGSMFKRDRPSGQVNTLAYWEAAAASRLIQIMTAGSANEMVLELDGWGAFTRTLHAGLGGKADKNADGVVTIDELADYSIPETLRGTKEAQHPQWGTLEGAGSILLVDARRLPPELRAARAAALLAKNRPVPAGLEADLRVIHDLMDQKRWTDAEKKVRKLALEREHPELNMLLAEIYLEADGLGNSSLIASELERAERATLAPEEQKRLLDLRARLEKVKRGPL